MARRRVLQVVQHLRPGGIETMVLDLMQRAADNTIVHIASLEGTRAEAMAAWPRLRDHDGRLHFMAKKPGLDLVVLARLAKRMRELGVAVVHTHHIGPMIYGGLAARLVGVRRLIHTEHDAWHLADPRRRRVQNLAMRLVRPIMVADAEMVARSLRSALPAALPITIPNGIDTERFAPGDAHAARARLGLPHGVPIIGCAARLEAVKGHRYLLEAMRRLPNEVHLALAGDGSLRAGLAKQAVGAGLAGRVHFLGQIDEMAMFHQAIDVFCLASEKEGLPLSPLEAQACGKPVVLSDVGGCKEAACPETARLVPAGAPAALAHALKESLAEKSTANPRDFVLRHRDVRRTVAAYEALYANPRTAKEMDHG